MANRLHIDSMLTLLAKGLKNSNLGRIYCIFASDNKLGWIYLTNSFIVNIHLMAIDQLEFTNSNYSNL